MLVLLFVSLCTNAQTQRQAASTATSDEKIGAISGRVVNESGQPLPNASVVVNGVGSTGMGQVAITNREGFFKLTGLEPVSYTIFAVLPAYTAKPRAPEGSPAPQYRVGDTVTLVLMKGGVITGSVTRSNGDPVVGIGVRARMVRDQDDRGSTSGATSDERTTDDRGVYRIYGLSPGTYIVVADGGNNHSGTGVNAFAGDIPTYAPSANRETAAEISVRAGEETGNVNITYRGERGRIISGTVSGIRTLEEGFSVVLKGVGTGGSEWTSFPEPGGNEFVFEGIPDGDYHIVAVSYLKDSERGLSESRVLNVRGADIGGIDLRPLPLASVSGRVVLEESKAAECTDKQRPVFAETFVSAWHRDTEAARQKPPFFWSMGVPVSPGADGNLTLRSLVPSQYYFVARLSAKDWYVQSITLAPKPVDGKTAKPIDAARTWTTLKSGDRLSGLTVTLAQGGASLHGQVAVAEGETLPEKLVVYLVPIERERAEDVLRYFAVAVTPDGQIAMNHLAPGRYWMLAQPAIDDAQPPLTKVRLPGGTETRAALRRAAEAAKNEIEFKPCQHVVDFRLKL